MITCIAAMSLAGCGSRNLQGQWKVENVIFIMDGGPNLTLSIQAYIAILLGLDDPDIKISGSMVYNFQSDGSLLRTLEYEAYFDGAAISDEVRDEGMWSIVDGRLRVALGGVICTHDFSINGNRMTTIERPADECYAAGNYLIIEHIISIFGLTGEFVELRQSFIRI